MWAIWRREWNGFLNSLVAYIAMVVFLLITGLFIWVFPDYSILEFGYAQLDQLFVIGPWVLMFLVPAVTMRFFSEEKRSGTAELLFTRPVSTSGVVLGKFLAGWALVLFSVLPTLCYVVALYYLAEPVGNLDLGGIAGSYLGLVLLGGVFAGIGTWASAVTEHPVVSFVLGVFLCFFMYAAFDSLRFLPLPNTALLVIEQLGIGAHFESMSKGVVDLRDLVYFASVTFFFLFWTRTVLDQRT
ncbi:MAG: gliding motility-associated ABC transporter permease subunit GldF [Bacteroidia bacterium]|jgi:ABC-2 type transport system permease protein|nr:gliding motility-associated ABC transporter permease subunit GldF [Bacteroidota bacterium]MCE2839887.1 gliding motility-associated ABC transporter permease subunit GldF [Bacteroidota bacterium]